MKDYLEGEIMKKRIRQKVLLIDSIINNLGFLFGLFVWVGLLVIGVRSIETRFLNTLFYEIILIIWLMVILMISNKLLISPSLVYQWEDVEEEDG